MSYKLFSPGPVDVSAKTYAAMTTPVMGHRSQDFVDLYQSVQPGLQKLFYTKDPVFLSTSSAWGAMEGALRNVVGKKVLNCMNGAFSDKWNDVAERCNIPAGKLQYEWGIAIKPADLRRELATGEYDAVTIIHNETSTGLMNDLPALAAVLKEFPEVISIVDMVSSFTAYPVKKDELGIDVLITGTQKALALPPGMALMSVSEKAFAKAETISGRGYYFDFLEFKANHLKGMTPSTPVIPLIFALRSKIEDIEAEGIEARYARHEKLNSLVHAWVRKNGFEFFAEEGYRSKSLTCVKNNRDLDVAGLNKALKQKYNCVIDGGYGKIKGKSFRISNMGDETEETITQLLAQLDTLLPDFLP